jgi:cytochrome c551/c552
MKKHFLIFFSLPVISLIGICATNLIKGNSPEPAIKNINSVTLTSSTMMLTNIQDQDRGIGPVKKVDLGPLNKKMIDEGKNIFDNKCFLCHDLDQKKIGPTLRNITKERTPEYIMNLMVNYAQMLKEDPILKSTFKKFNNVPMTDPALNQTQARSVLEYLRSVVK